MMRFRAVLAIACIQIHRLISESDDYLTVSAVDNISNLVIFGIAGALGGAGLVHAICKVWKVCDFWIFGGDYSCGVSLTEMGQISGAARFYVCGPLVLGVLASWGLVLSYVSLSAKHSHKISITGSKLTELLFTVPLSPKSQSLISIMWMYGWRSKPYCINVGPDYWQECTSRHGTQVRRHLSPISSRWFSGTGNYFLARQCKQFGEQKSLSRMLLWMVAESMWAHESEIKNQVWLTRFIDESRLPVSIVALVFLIQLCVYTPSLGG